MAGVRPERNSIPIAKNGKASWGLAEVTGFPGLDFEDGKKTKQQLRSNAERVEQMAEFKMTSSIAGHTAISRSAFCMRVVTERRMGRTRPQLVLLGAALVLLAASADSVAQVAHAVT